MRNDDGPSPALFFRSLKASLVLTVAIALYAWAALDWAWAHAFLFFAFWNILNLYFFATLLLGLVERQGLVAMASRLAALAALIAILLLFSTLTQPKLSAFLYGFHLPYLVLILKIAGWRFCQRRDAETRDDGRLEQGENDSHA